MAKYIEQKIKDEENYRQGYRPNADNMYRQNYR